MLTVEQSLPQQQDQLAVAEGAVVQNLVAIYKSLGGGWQIRLDNAAQQTPPAIAQPTGLAPASAQ